MKCRALVVEDDPAIVMLATDALVSMGHEFDIAASQQEALRYLDRQQYSYILLDIEIPAQIHNSVARIQNTENMLESIVEGCEKSAPPIILLSDYAVNGLDGTIKVMRLAMALARRGAMDIIGKPFPTAGRTLDRVVKKALRIRRAAQRQAPQAPVLPAPNSTQSKAVAPEPSHLTVTQAAELLMRDWPALDLPRARARVSAAAGRNEFRHSGTRMERRIDRISFDAWRLRQRDRDLDLEDQEEDGLDGHAASGGHVEDHWANLPMRNS